ncbi:MAG: nucleotide exchange factor GrpE [Candidatus Promineifilaceae bacterium]|nr:nucleotide exchange factor GrpE [Candidatus Promineifilaceae bacterium]
MTEDLRSENTDEREEIFLTEEPDQQSDGQEGEDIQEELPIEEQLAVAKAEAASHLDGYLRAQAELANARKRFEKQQMMAYSNANADLVSKLLPVLDDFERAVENVPESISEDNWFEGIQLVQRKLIAILDSLNVKEIEALGQPFDPNFHDALAQEPSEDYEEGTVMRVMVKGYQVGDKVIRPCLVTVAG